MNKQITIRVADIINSPLCISAEDGQRVFDKIVPLLKAGIYITISFERVTTLISLFLSVAIGQLYGLFAEERIHDQIKVDGLNYDDLEMLKKVVDNAKIYYANKKT
jgi:hypothetical protein